MCVRCSSMCRFFSSHLVASFGTLLVTLTEETRGEEREPTERVEVRTLGGRSASSSPPTRRLQRAFKSATSFCAPKTLERPLER